MAKSPVTRRLLSLAITAAVVAALLLLVRPLRSLPVPQAANAAEKGTADATEGRSWPLFGGSVSRNLVNLVEHNLPTEWNVEQGKEKNVKWVADLGSKAYGGPIVARGKILVGTNNQAPRNRSITGDKGILM